MTLRAFFLWIFLPALVIIFNSCETQPKSDSCCTFSDARAVAGVKGDLGALQVQGSTSARYYVLDQTGKQLASGLLNETVRLYPGPYTLKVNNSTHPISVEEGILTQCSTGTLIVNGNTSDYYYVIDSASHELVHAALGNFTSFFPGVFQIRVNNTEISVEVKLKELTEVRTGTLLVHGSTDESYYVLDDTNKQLNYNTLEKPLAFLPGTYLVKVNNTSMKADVYAGSVTELTTGNVLVKGLTEEYYYVTDTLGNALNYQNLNKPLAFFPGDLMVQVNNTMMPAEVLGGHTAEFVTGSLRLTGGGTGYYYVLDETGTQLNYNSLNKPLSFFPSEYIVKLGSSTRKATVTAGELTSISAFN